MGKRHVALVVEDNLRTQAQCKEILDSVGCDSVVYDNKVDALEALRTQQFCVVLLDLGIRAVPDSMSSHEEHGRSLLRELRKLHWEQNERDCHLLPVLIVSGIDWDVDDAVAVMKDGADDIIQKASNSSRDLSEAIRVALDRSGRSTHDACAGVVELAARLRGALEGSGQPSNGASSTSGRGPKEPTGAGTKFSIPAHRDKRRVVVMGDEQPLFFTESLLWAFLRILVAHVNGEAVHRNLLGASDEHGFQTISRLRVVLKPVTPAGEDFFVNHYASTYKLRDDATIGEINWEGLDALGNAKISEVARELKSALERLPKA